MPENAEPIIQNGQETDEMFNFDAEKHDEVQNDEPSEPPGLLDPEPEEEDEFEEESVTQLRQHKAAKDVLEEIQRRKKPNASRVVDLLSDDEPEETPALYLDVSEDDRTARLVQFFDTMDYEDHKEWSVKVIRKTPEEIKGEPAAGFLESFPFPKSYFSLQINILKKYGGGTYRLVVVDAKEKIKKTKHISLPGNPIQKKNISEEEEENITSQRINPMDSTAMQTLQRELYDLKAQKMADDARREATQSFEKLADRGNSDVMDIMKLIVASNQPKNGTSEQSEMVKELKRQNDILERRIESQGSSNSTIEMVKAFASVMAVMKPEAQKSEIDKLLPLFLDSMNKEDPTKNLLLQNILNKKESSSDDMLTKMMDIPLNMVKKLSEIKMESMTATPAEETGDITPKDLLMTGAGVFENIFEKMYPGQNISPEQLQYMQQHGGMPPAQQAPPPQNYPPQVVGPQTQYNQQQAAQAAAQQAQQQQQEETEVQVYELNAEMRERVKGSIEEGASGENFGRLILDNVPLQEWKPTIEQLSVDEIAALLSTLLEPMVGEELSNILSKTDNGKKYAKEAITYIKTNI